MNKKTMDFPEYRKMKNNKAFYKIINEKEFDEIQLIGNKAKLFHIVAEQYPEMLRIQDMLKMDNDWFLEFNENEFNDVLKKHDLE